MLVHLHSDIIVSTKISKEVFISAFNLMTGPTQLISAWSQSELGTIFKLGWWTELMDSHSSLVVRNDGFPQ